MSCALSEHNIAALLPGSGRSDLKHGGATCRRNASPLLLPMQFRTSHSAAESSAPQTE
jgi:hypothetical protein